MLGGLRRIQAKAYEISTVIIHKADQVHLLASQAEAHDVRLPHLVRGGPFEKPRLRRIVLTRRLRRRREALVNKNLPDLLAAARKTEPAA